MASGTIFCIYGHIVKLHFACKIKTRHPKRVPCLMVPVTCFYGLEMFLLVFCGVCLAITLYSSLAENSPPDCFLFARLRVRSPREGKIKTEIPKGYLGFMVPVTGLEPVRYRYRRILSPLRLPIPSHRQITLTIIQYVKEKIK